MVVTRVKINMTAVTAVTAEIHGPDNCRITEIPTASADSPTRERRRPRSFHSTRSQGDAIHPAIDRNRSVPRLKPTVRRLVAERSAAPASDCAPTSSAALTRTPRAKRSAENGNDLKEATSARHSSAHSACSSAGIEAIVSSTLRSARRAIRPRTSSSASARRTARTSSPRKAPRVSATPTAVFTRVPSGRWAGALGVTDQVRQDARQERGEPRFHRSG